MNAKLPFRNERLAWPTDAEQLLANTGPDELEKMGILLLRLGKTALAESYFLAGLARYSSGGVATERIILLLELMCGVRQRQGDQEACLVLVSQAEKLSDAMGIEHLCSLKLRRAQLSHSGFDRDISPEDLIRSWLARNPFEQVQWVSELIRLGDRSSISLVLSAWPRELSSPEALEIKAGAYQAVGDNAKAETSLNELLGRTDGTAQAWRRAIELNIIANRNNGIALAKATQLHPNDTGIATHRVLVELKQRHAAKARRSAYRERLLYSVKKQCHNRQQSDTNLLASIELTGRADLLQAIHPSIECRIIDSPALNMNLVMQMASLGSQQYAKRAQALAKCMPERVELPKRKGNKNLKIGLVSSDLYYHPVGRFVQMLMKRGFGIRGEVHILNTGADAMQGIRSHQNVIYHNLKQLNGQARLNTIRSLELDVAVDLAGWTGENNGVLFSHGLAPIQANYLGYFASSGLDAMDLWLGDHNLFPHPMHEWHSEQIVRLNRPFLAWQPDTSLPEGRVEVPAAPSGPIRFGSFNNARKLSASTLKLWGKILQALPNAQLFLKAFMSDDPGIIELIQRRMIACGVDLTRITWLPTCPSPEDHLRQYGLIDVGLDPFPNGGCTTTCEALWMGVPVITLCGTHYVSRMSTAVLRGANLGEWVADSEEQYLALAERAATSVGEIRRARCELRAHVSNSPLGDAQDLAEQLWDCFEQLG